MHIAFVTHNIIKGDGQGRVNYEVVREALRQGHSVDLFADRVDQELVELGARWIRVEKRFSKLLLFAVSDFAPRANHAVKATGIDYDVVNVNGYCLTGPHDVNSVHFVHNSWRKSRHHDSRGKLGPWELYQKLYSFSNSKWERMAFNNAKQLVAVSEMVRSELTASGIAPDKITVINNGVDIQQFCPGTQSRAEIGLPDGVPLALFVGDLRLKRKNLDTVLRALANTENLHLGVIGSLEGSPYVKLAEDLGVKDKTHFLGYRKDVANIMRSVDFFICPSRYDPFALVVLEAMATGLPVIAAASVGASYLVEENAGFVVPDAESAKDLAARMQQLADNPSLRRSMGTRAREIAEANSWTAMAERYLNVYAQERPKQLARTNAG